MFTSEIEKGMGELDRVHPTWPQDVDPDRLDMAEGFYMAEAAEDAHGHVGCMLAQIWGDYYEGAEYLGLAGWGEAGDYGFWLPGWCERGAGVWDKLTAEWVAAIEGRRAA